jgi:transposase
VGRGDLTDAQWRRLEPHLPPEKPWTGHPNAPHRRIIDGILWILRTGAPWRDLPARYGPVGTVSSRFYRWRASGVWDRIPAALQAAAEAAGEIDWDLHHVDATVIRAHQHAAGARRDGAMGGVRRRPGRRWGAARAASRPSCTCGPKATAGRSRRC